MKIYVYLIGEGTDCWRPVEAFQVKDNWFQITDTAPEGEDWEYLCGDMVRCEFRPDSSDLVAVEKRKSIDEDSII